MYFLSRTNRAYSWCAHRTPVQRYVFTIVCIGVFVWVWFVFVYAHTRARAQAHLHHMTLLTQQGDQCMRSRRACTELNTSIASLDATVSSYRHESSCNTQHCIATLVKLSRAAKLRFKGCMVEHDGSMTLSCAGSLRNSIYFLHALKESSLLVQCTRVHLQSTSADACVLTCALKMM